MLTLNPIFSFWPSFRESFKTPTRIMRATITSGGSAFPATQFAMRWTMVMELPSVLGIGCKNQVVGRVIVSVFIFVVNFFVRLKKATNLFLHHQSMLPYSASGICIGMPPANNNQVSVTETSPFIIGVSFWAYFETLGMTRSASCYSFAGNIKNWFITIKAIALRIFSYVH